MKIQTKNNVSKDIYEKILKALFGSHENFERVRKDKFYPELDVAKRFASMFVDETNVDLFTSLLHKVVEDEDYIDGVYTFDGVHIPFNISVFNNRYEHGDKPRERRKNKSRKSNASLEERCYRAMYSSVYAYRDSRRDDIIDGKNLDEIKEVSERIFNEWCVLFMDMNNNRERAANIAFSLKVPALRRGAWKRK